MISLNTQAKQNIHSPDWEMFWMDLRWLKTRHNVPRWSEFSSQVISLSKQGNQGIHSPDWEMFWMGLRWLKIRHNVPRWSEFSSQMSLNGFNKISAWEMFFLIFNTCEKQHWCIFRIFRTNSHSFNTKNCFPWPTPTPWSYNKLEKNISPMGWIPQAPEWVILFRGAPHHRM